jgi:hypothetical protein
MLEKPACSTGGSVKSRLIASVALGAVIVLGTSGCAILSTQATTIPYSPGDGVNIPDSGPLQVRNVLIVSEGDNAEGNLVAAVVNPTEEAHTLNIELGEGASAETATVRVPAGETVSLGAPDGEPPLPLERIDGAPGSTVPVYFQSGDGEGVLYQVPILDGALDYYGELLP